jgi:hypothetical protein
MFPRPTFPTLCLALAAALVSTLALTGAETVAAAPMQVAAAPAW